MATYKELKDRFFDEVGKVDLSKLGLTFGGLKEYAELLKIMAEIPDEPTEDRLKYGFTNLNTAFTSSVPKIDDKEE